MDRVGEVLPIKLRSEKTMQSESGGKSKEEREGERQKCGYSLRQWNEQNDEGARAKSVAVDSTNKKEELLPNFLGFLYLTTGAVERTRGDRNKGKKIDFKL